MTIHTVPVKVRQRRTQRCQDVDRLTQENQQNDDVDDADNHLLITLALQPEFIGPHNWSRTDLSCHIRCHTNISYHVISYHIVDLQNRLKVGTDKPKLKVKMQLVSDDNVRKRLLEKPRFELAAKGVFRLKRCSVFWQGVPAEVHSCGFVLHTLAEERLNSEVILITFDSI